jgi:rhodanese-related sulfurtransferase
VAKDGINMKSVRESFKDTIQSQLRTIPSISSETSSLLPTITEMTCGDVRLTIDAGGVLVDVRQPIDFQGKKVHLAANIPCEFIVKEIQGSNYSYNLPIMVYCNDGYTAQLAKQKLEEVGYKNVVNLGSLKTFRNCS